MKPKISLITLGVSDLARSVDFYTRLGFPLAEQNKDIAFFSLDGSWLSLYPLAKLAEDACRKPDRHHGFPGFTLAHNEPSPEAVDRVLQEAENAGAKIVKPAQKVFWGGYSGYFSDLDEYLWEVAYNPFMDLT